MKKNSIGLVSVVILVVSFFGVGLYHGYEFVYGVEANQESKIASISDEINREKPKIPPIDAVMRSKISQLHPRLNQLHNPKQAVTGDINMQMVGFSSQALEQSERILSQAKEDYQARIISMAYVAGENRFAVIDGRLYREGDDFGDTGAKIRTIRQDKVLIAGRDVRQWLDVHNPVAVAKKAPVQPTQVAAAPPVAAAPHQAPPAAKDKVSSIEEGVQALKGYSDMMKALQGQ
ncbi:MAG: hypothetical protein H7833_09230 [Magnetococcus sp. DMHC-1]|nr:hypothetical protein [Magnetococcales bacterium]